MSIVQDEARRVHAYETTFSDLEYSVNTDIQVWAYGNKRENESYRTKVQSYWREVHGIEV